jgi:CHAD domain-containing protein
MQESVSKINENSGVSTSMTAATKPKLETLGNCAFLAIEKQFQKVFKWETAVKKDKDLEALHQMRVGMRRLRTTVSRFAEAVNLPKAASDKNIGKIAKRLGNLRDLDVLKESLETLYVPELPPQEQKLLETAFDDLEKEREDALLDVRATLKDERYKSLKHQLQDWLEQPTYQPLASMSIQQALPELLLPELSQFLLHQGWLVGTQACENEIVISTNWEPQNIEQELATNGKVLHSLRKQAKRLRYQMELFSNLYGESYSAYIKEVKSIQEILGAMQDSVVLSQWLTDVFKSKFHTQFPTLTTLLSENRYQLWQQWQPLQERYLTTETRQQFYLAILQPISLRM